MNKILFFILLNLSFYSIYIYSADASTDSESVRSSVSELSSPSNSPKLQSPRDPKKDNEVKLQISKLLYDWIEKDIKQIKSHKEELEKIYTHVVDIVVKQPKLFEDWVRDFEVEMSLKNTELSSLIQNLMAIEYVIWFKRNKQIQNSIKLSSIAMSEIHDMVLKTIVDPDGRIFRSIKAEKK